jgi:hypothetical protein
MWFLLAGAKNTNARRVGGHCFFYLLKRIRASEGYLAMNARQICVDSKGGYKLFSEKGLDKFSTGGCQGRMGMTHQTSQKPA